MQRFCHCSHTWSGMTCRFLVQMFLPNLEKFKMEIAAKLTKLGQTVDLVALFFVTFFCFLLQEHSSVRDSVEKKTAAGQMW